MIDRLLAGSRSWLARHGLVVALPLAMAGAMLLPPDLVPLEAAADERPWAAELSELIAELPSGASVVIGFDPDIGTYPEVRTATRRVLADLLERRATLSFVSYTPEGRALAVAELARLARVGVAPPRLVDLGYVPGSEAALVRSVTALGQPDAGRPAGLERFDLAVVVGGIDLHPRIWVEQVRPRVPALPIVGIAPTLLYPELRPYLASGQLDALLGTFGDGVAYAARSPEPDERLVIGRPLSPIALLVGMLAAAGVLLHATTRVPVRIAWRRLRRPADRR